MYRVLRWLTEWKAVIVVSFLRIIVRANFIHPELNWLFSFVLHERSTKNDETYEFGTYLIVHVGSIIYFVRKTVLKHIQHSSHM
jgi:hypothetical protein